MKKDDSVFAGHMLDAATSIRDKLAGKSRADYDADENLRLALAHLVQRIGEAARKVSPEYRGLHPQIPWARIVGMRHRIVHDYLYVDFDLLWQVASENIPQLIAELEGIVPPPGP